MGIVRAFPVQRQIEPFSVAVDAYHAAAPAECVTLLHGHVTAAAHVLRARANLRLGQYNAALATLELVDQSRLHSSLERSEFLVVRGAVETRLRDFDAARATFDDARIYSISAASASAAAEYHFYQGVWSFAALDFEQTDCEVIAALTVEQAPFESAAYFVPLANTRARVMQLRGLVAAGRERYREHTDCLRSAISEMRRAETSDLWIFASLLMNLAFQVRDFDLTDDAQMLRDEMAIAQWPSELASMEFEIFRALGWSSALRGNHLGALRDFRRSAECAPTSAQKIVASTDRAYIGREIGETYSVREELEYAAALAKRVDWDAVGGDGDRFALVLLARQLAYFNVVQARTTYERYRALKTKLPPGALNNFDRRIRAHEYVAEGTILRIEGKTEAARSRLITAFKIWNQLGYDWLAATAAVELLELEPNDTFEACADRAAKTRPNSWLARRLDIIKRRSGITTQRFAQLADRAS